MLRQWRQWRQWETLIKLSKKGGIWSSNDPKKFKAQIRGTSSNKILKWTIFIWIIQIMRLISLNLACKIAKFSYFLYCRNNHDNCCDNHCLQKIFVFATMWRGNYLLFTHKRFMLDGIVSGNASNFATFLVRRTAKKFSKVLKWHWLIFSLFGTLD